MSIALLRITNFRNLSDVDIAPIPQGLNIFCGDNGSGKTSLIEAIHYLGVGRSFRQAAALRLIRDTSDKFTIFSHLMNSLENIVPVGIERGIQGALRLRMAEQDILSIIELAALLPLRLIHSNSHHLFESGPTYRRKYLDWGLFYQSAHFLTAWRQFERVIKQRNSLLRENKAKRDVDPWTEELIKHGLVLNQLRKEYIQDLLPLLKRVAHELVGLSEKDTEQLEMKYHPGWEENLDYRSALAAHYAEECRLGYTVYGPHRADIDIRIGQVSIKHFLSRGQQKLWICAMIIAQGMLLKNQVNKGPIYLVDDLPSELDAQSRKRLLSLLADQQTQVFITAIDKEAICAGIGSKVPGLSVSKMSIPHTIVKVFHVEHGKIEAAC